MVMLNDTQTGNVKFMNEKTRQEVVNKLVQSFISKF